MTWLLCALALFTVPSAVAGGDAPGADSLARYVQVNEQLAAKNPEGVVALLHPDLLAALTWGSGSTPKAVAAIRASITQAESLGLHHSPDGWAVQGECRAAGSVHSFVQHSSWTEPKLAALALDPQGEWRVRQHPGIPATPESLQTAAINPVGEAGRAWAAIAANRNVMFSDPERYAATLHPAGMAEGGEAIRYVFSRVEVPGPAMPPPVADPVAEGRAMVAWMYARSAEGIFKDGFEVSTQYEPLCVIPHRDGYCFAHRETDTWRRRTTAADGASTTTGGTGATSRVDCARPVDGRWLVSLEREMKDFQAKRDAMLAVQDIVAPTGE